MEPSSATSRVEVNFNYIIIFGVNKQCSSLMQQGQVLAQVFGHFRIIQYVRYWTKLLRRKKIYDHTMMRAYIYHPAFSPSTSHTRLFGTAGPLFKRSESP